ncbi:MAG: DUF72 domain-containing protein [Chloroflexi bacterium]|nr:DUF72 domain-containing protein [Chloroflexota bacterium]
MDNVFLGTCSWTDRELIQAGTFYPKKSMSAEARLRWYASVFPTVEIDSSYYSLPTATNSRLWVERTPEGFVFHVKMFRLFTFHWTEPAALPADLRPLAPKDKQRFYLRDAPKELADELMKRFAEALLPLDSAGKLGVVLFQCPRWVLPRPEVFDHLIVMQEVLSQFQLAVEFRNQAWLSGDRQEQTLRWLEEHRMTFVCVDMPQGFASSISPVARATTDVAYVRFHGRNRETWEKATQTSAERFNWYYSDEELREWVPKIRGLQEQAREVHVLFNTNSQDQGPKNALRMGRLLGEGLGKEDAVQAVQITLGLG